MPVLTWGSMKDRKKNKLSIIFSFTFFGIILFYSQTIALCQSSESDIFPVLFYNVENLFDCFDDTLKNDEEFLPSSLRHWSFKRYNEKVNKTAKVILASNAWDLPVLVGLCEVENDAVLKRLVWETGLGESGYRFIHHESPDKRGVDVALLYRRAMFRVLADTAICVSDPGAGFFTRDILYVKGVMFDEDILNVFVCHLPSNYGGEFNSEKSRMMVAVKLSELCDSLFKADKESKILIMGDMNEQSGSNATGRELKAGKRNSDTPLVDLSFDIIATTVKGTVKYHGQWSVFDRIIVSRSLMRKPFSVEGMYVVELPFLLEPDESYPGVKPFRTYSGPRYLGGFSDHLPVKAVIRKER